MKKFNVTINCKAVYTSQIEVPDNATFADAIQIAKANIKDIPLGILEHIPESDRIDEYNCDFEEEYNETDCEDDEILSPEKENIINLWNEFDIEMQNRGYKIAIMDEEVRDEERNIFGKSLSCLGTTAYKDDNFCAKIKLIVNNEYTGFDIVVYEGDGTNMIKTKEIGRLTFSEYTEETLITGIDKVISVFGGFNKDNPIPQSWENLEKI